MIHYSPTLLQRRISVLAFAAAMIFANGAAASSVKVYESTTYYKISGRTAGDLMSEMREKGPDSLFSIGEALASTQTYMSWNFRTSVTEAGCALDTVDISLDLTYTMPKWKEYENGNRKLKKAWDLFMESLWIHEKGHGEISRRGADILLQQFEGMVPEENCEKLQDAMKQIAKHINLKVINPAQRKYERLTNEGQAQGAKL